MTFSLTLSSSDLLLLLPEIFLTCWLCVVLIVDFSFPRLPKENLAYLSVAGLLVTLGCLGWFDFAGISGALFSNMFVVDRMALFFKIFIVAATILVILASIEFIHRFTFFRGEYYFLVVMSALGMVRDSISSFPGSPPTRTRRRPRRSLPSQREGARPFCWSRTTPACAFCSGMLCESSDTG